MSSKAVPRNTDELGATWGQDGAFIRFTTPRIQTKWEATLQLKFGVLRCLFLDI